MDRFSVDDTGENQLSYREALEFIGEVRAGISWERFCMSAVRHSDAFIDILNDSGGVGDFLASRGIGIEYARSGAEDILERLYFNRDNNHYLTLALPYTASEAQIHKRWKELMLIYHPDRSNSDNAARCAKKINEAYSILKNPVKKAEYDRKMAKAAGAYSKGRRSKRRKPEPQSEPFISSDGRRLIRKLVLPLCAATACIILLILFIENGSRVYNGGAYANRPAVAEKIDRRGTPPNGASDGTSGAPGGAIGSGQTNVVGDLLNGVSNQAELKQMDTKAPDALSGQRSSPKNRSDKTIRPQQLEKKTARETVAEKGERDKTDVPVAATSRVILVRKETASSGVPPATSSRANSGDDAGSRGDLFARQQNDSPNANRNAAVENALHKEERDGLEKEVFHFIARYVQTYEEGDIDRFMSFFSISAVENNSLKYGDIKQFYKRNFERNSYKYLLRNLRLQKNDDSIVVSGEYTIRRLNVGNERKTNGTIRWVLAQEDGGLKIVRMDYEKK